MCGIFGYKLNRTLNESDISKSLKHLSLLSNRGPDNQGYYIDKENGVFLGHTRLSIVALIVVLTISFICLKTFL